MFFLKILAVCHKTEVWKYNLAIPLLFSSNVLNVTRGDSCVVEGNEEHNNINSFSISRFSLGQYKILYWC